MLRAGVRLRGKDMAKTLLALRSAFALIGFMIRTVKALLPLGERPLGTAPAGPHVMRALCAKSKIPPHLLLPFSAPAPRRLVQSACTLLLGDVNAAPVQVYSWLSALV